MPKKTPLLTDWVTVGTAGPTIDGREIPDQLLEQAAANYDPEEYTAVINSDHLLGFYGNFGSVAELRTAKDKKQRTVLQARLAPNKRLLQMNSDGQRMFTSMELTDNYADSGEGYLVGLAVTDMPASLGTTALSFSKRAETPATFCTAPIALALEDDPSTEQSGEGKDAHLLRRLINAFMSNADAAGSVAAFSTENPTDPDEDDEMTKEQFEALMGAFQSLESKLGTQQPAAGTEAKPEAPAEQFSTLAAQVQALSDKLDALNKPAGEGKGEGEEGKGDEGKGTDQFAQLSEQLSALTTQFNALMQERPDGRKPAGTGAAADGGFV